MARFAHDATERPRFGTPAETNLFCTYVRLPQRYRQHMFVQFSIDLNHLVGYAVATKLNN
jgi:hypothetical protein